MSTVNAEPLESLVPSQPRVVQQEPIPDSMVTRAARGVAWTVIGQTCHRLFTAIAAIVVARILGPGHFGEFTMIRSTMRVFTVMAGFRLGSTSTKYVAQHRTDNPLKAARVLELTLKVAYASCAVLAAALVLLAPYLAREQLHRPELAGALMISAGLMFFMMMGNIVTAGLAGFEDFKGIAWVSSVRGLLNLLVCVPLTYFWGVSGALTGLAIVAGIVFVQLWMRLRRIAREHEFPVGLRWRDVKSEASVLHAFALPAVASGMIFTGMGWLGRSMLLNQPGGDVALGMFGAADQWRLMVLFLPSVLRSVALPLLANAHQQETKAGFSNVVSLNIEAVYRISLPISLAVMGAAGLLTGLFGSAYLGSERVLPVLMLSVFLNSLNQALRQVFNGSGRTWVNLSLHLGWAVAFFAAASYFLPRYNAVGFAIAFVLADLVLLISQSLLIDRFIAKGSLQRHVFPMFVGLVILLGLCWLVLNTNGAITLAVAALAVFATAMPTLKILWMRRTQLYAAF